jgi:uncharacterized membrane protein YphA (DoxX/SURF4 family)
MIIFPCILALAVVASGAAKLRKSPQVIEGMAHVGVTETQVPVLAGLEILGGLGLLVGFGVTNLGRLAAGGLALYFVGALVAHARVKDAVKVMAAGVLAFRHRRRHCRSADQPLMARHSNWWSEPPVYLSLLDTGTSTIRLLFKIWGATRREDRLHAGQRPDDTHHGGTDANTGIAA